MASSSSTRPLTSGPFPRWRQVSAPCPPCPPCLEGTTASFWGRRRTRSCSRGPGSCRGAGLFEPSSLRRCVAMEPDWIFQKTNRKLCGLQSCSTQCHKNRALLPIAIACLASALQEGGRSQRSSAVVSPVGHGQGATTIVSPLRPSASTGPRNRTSVF